MILIMLPSVLCSLTDDCWVISDSWTGQSLRKKNGSGSRCALQHRSRQHCLLAMYRLPLLLCAKMTSMPFAWEASPSHCVHTGSASANSLPHRLSYSSLLQGSLPDHHDPVCCGVCVVAGAQLLDDALARPASWPGQHPLPAFLHTLPAASMSTPLEVQSAAQGRILPESGRLLAP